MDFNHRQEFGSYRRIIVSVFFVEVVGKKPVDVQINSVQSAHPLTKLNYHVQKTNMKRQCTLQLLVLLQPMPRGARLATIGGDCYELNQYDLAQHDHINSPEGSG